MPRWTQIARVSDCSPGSCRELIVEDRVVALVREGESFFALDGVCPHQGGPLGQGSAVEGVLTCPWHGWQFDIRTGCNLAHRGIVQPSLPVRIEEDVIYVDLDPPQADD